MRLSIITINRNNAGGLGKTVSSVVSQTCKSFEYIIIDGASTDNSADIIKRYSNSFGDRLKWVSEPDGGIYSAMNKGIGLASGDYVEFLNSGDYLASGDVVDRMTSALEGNAYPSILYGNMLKDMPNGCLVRDRGFAGHDITFHGFYTGTLNHSPAVIRKDLFNKYGLYDESLRIVSDWKWFLQAIILGEEKPVYTDVDVTVFDMNGISETNKKLDRIERRAVLNELIPKSIIADYDQLSFLIEQMKRLKRYPWAYKLVWFIERCLFKIEKRKTRRTMETIAK